MATTTSFDRRVLSLWDAVSLPSSRNVAVAAVIAAVVAVVAAIGVLASSPTYESRATVSIDQPAAIAQSTDAGVVEKLDRLRLKYAGIGDTDPIVAPTAKATGLKADDVRHHTVVYAGPQSLLLFPIATSDTEHGAERLAAALADSLVRYADREQVRAGIPANQRYHLTVIERSSTARKTSPSSRIATATAALAALLTLAMAYIVLQLVTARRRLG